MAPSPSRFKTLRVIVLTHQDLVPPVRLVSAKEREFQPWKTDYDVIHALQRMGHQVQVVGLAGDLAVLREAVEKFKPQIVFNLLDEFDGQASFDHNVVSYLELLGIPYTGCNPRGLMLARDKALSKKVFAYHNIPFPGFWTFAKKQPIRFPRDIKFPVIVKSLTEQASLGISQASVVDDVEKLRERIEFIHQSVGTDAIVEQYIEGKELYVGVLGNQRVEAFPIWELKFRKTPDSFLEIATSKVKWNPNYRRKYGITSGIATALDPFTKRKIINLSKKAVKVLGLNGYARVDMRLSAKKEIFLLEVNPNPDIAREEDFSQSAEKAGMNYHDLLNRILYTGLRWKPKVAA